MKNELLQGLTKEQIEKARNCKNADELLSLAKEEGIELTEEQLTEVNGGGTCQSTPHPTCSVCQSKDVKVKRESTGVLFDYQFYCKCRNCGHFWYIF